MHRDTYIREKDQQDAHFFPLIYSNQTILYILHVCTVHQQYQSTFLLFQTDAHNYKIIGILKQLKF